MKLGLSYLFLCLLFALPKNLLSRFVGWLAERRWPQALRHAIHRVFVTSFGIDMSEAKRDLSEFDTIQEIFIRSLKDGARDIQEEPVSPSDGTLSYSLPIVSGNPSLAIQAKGLYYEPKELVFGKGSSPEINLSWFSTVYLAPHNYHRVHSPVSAELLGIRYIPGNLWPVNGPIVATLPRIFCLNERLVFDLRCQGRMVYVVMVGATNVGKIQTPFWEGMLTNQTKGLKIDYHELQDTSVLAGDELGTFMLGSTVVTVFEDHKSLNLRQVSSPEKILMGESLGLKSQEH